MSANLHQDLLQKYVDSCTPEPRHYERIPAILDYLTYIEQELDEETGELNWYRKRLTPTQKDIYRIVKQKCQGGQSVCFATQKHIADQAECSNNAVVEASRVFSLAFEQLDGSPLVLCEKKYVLTKRSKEDGQDVKVNKRPVNISSLVDVWRWNNAFMDTADRTKFPERKQRITEKEAELSIEKMRQQSISSAVHNSGAELKNQHSPKAQLKNQRSAQGSRSGSVENSTVFKQHVPIQHASKRQDTTAEPVSAVQIALLRSDVGVAFTSESSAVAWLGQFGFQRKAITELMNYPLHELHAGVIHARRTLDKNGFKGTATGFLISTMKNKWWMPKGY